MHFKKILFSLCLNCFELVWYLLNLMLTSKRIYEVSFQSTNGMGGKVNIAATRLDTMTNGILRDLLMCLMKV